MSVAFRRDSDEEHLEPKFELPVPLGPNLVTQRGLELIGRQIGAFERKLASAGDEATVAAARRDLHYWRSRQITAELAPVPCGRTVQFGVTVHARVNGKTRSFAIVGDDEADPAARTISFQAPLSKAMMGAEAGDIVPFGNLAEAIEILAISVPD